MAKKTKWADLPNAHHIDRVIADVKARPEVWRAAQTGVMYNAVRDAAWNAAWNAAHEARPAGHNVGWRAAWRTKSARLAKDAILCLAAYDDCGYLLDSNPEHVKVLAALGQDQAILLLSAVTALNNKG